MARLCAHMKCTVADLFRVFVIEQAAELPAPEPKPGKGRKVAATAAAPEPTEPAGKRGGKIDLARVNAETTWPLKKLDAAVYAQLASYKGRGPHSLGRLIEEMTARGVVPGRMTWALHRLEMAGRIKLHHGKLTSVDIELRQYLPTNDRDRRYVAAKALR